jgi:hypothetical protein
MAYPGVLALADMDATGALALAPRQPAGPPPEHLVMGKGKGKDKGKGKGLLKAKAKARAKPKAVNLMTADLLMACIMESGGMDVHEALELHARLGFWLGV